MRKNIINKVNNGAIACKIKAGRMAEKVAVKLKEQEGSLLEYLGEHIIGVVLIGIILAALIAVVANTVMPNITTKIQNAFTFS